MRIFTIVVCTADAFGTPLPDMEIVAESSRAACAEAWSKLRPEQQDYTESIECVAVRELNEPRP